MTVVPVTITTELMEHTDGRPVAYIDATAVAVFAYQQADGACIIDICTRDDTAPGQLRLFLDGEPLLLTQTE
jgi:hypothetical protein